MEHEKSRCVFSRGAPEKIGTRIVVTRKFGLDRAAPGHRSATAVSDRCHKIDILPHGIILVRQDVDLVAAIRNGSGASVTWRSPIQTKFPRNNDARVDFFWCAARKNAPTVFMLHALMSATHIGYRRWAARFNELGWNACFVHLPYHYSRVPPGHWNG